MQIASNLNLAASSYSPLGLRYSKVMSLRQNDYGHVLPLLNDAHRIRPSSEGMIDVQSTGSFKMVRLPQHRAALRRCTHAHLAGSPLPDLQRETLDALVHDLLPHVLQTSDLTGEALSLEDCVFFDCFMETGGYYPCLHWDNNCPWARPHHRSFT